MLLDTHALLWFWEGNTSLSAVERAAIETSENEKFVSHVSVWEIVVKHSLGKLTLTVPFDELFPAALDSSGFSLLATNVEHFRVLLALPFHPPRSIRSSLDCPMPRGWTYLPVG